MRSSCLGSNIGSSFSLAEKDVYAQLTEIGLPQLLPWNIEGHIFNGSYGISFEKEDERNDIITGRWTVIL